MASRNQSSALRRGSRQFWFHPGLPPELQPQFDFQR